MKFSFLQTLIFLPGTNENRLEENIVITIFLFIFDGF